MSEAADEQKNQRAARGASSLPSARSNGWFQDPDPLVPPGSRDGCENRARTSIRRSGCQGTRSRARLRQSPISALASCEPVAPSTTVRRHPGRHSTSPSHAVSRTHWGSGPVAKHPWSWLLPSFPCRGRFLFSGRKQPDSPPGHPGCGCGARARSCQAGRRGQSRPLLATRHRRLSRHHALPGTRKRRI